MSESPTCFSNCFLPCLIQAYHTSHRPCSISGCQSSMHVHVMQAESSTLRQELQDLQSSTAEAEKQLQNEVSSLEGQLETALAECAKASQGQGQLETALKNSRNAHQQREAAFKARRAAEVCSTLATLTWPDLAVNQLSCPSLRQCMRLCVTLCNPFLMCC